MLATFPPDHVFFLVVKIEFLTESFLGAIFLCPTDFPIIPKKNLENLKTN